MFYRKKIILNLLNTFGGKLNKLSFVKILFLFNADEEYPYYEFTPYNYGAFSFTAYSDINGLKKKEIIDDTGENFILKHFDEQIYKINTCDFEKIKNLYERFKDTTYKDLIKLTYESYPYYAKNSKMNKYITKQIQDRIKSEISQDNKTTLFDLGYEGKSLEAYFNLLIKNNINTLIDVRKNPISMKYGFSKNTLSRTANALNIVYTHIPELGIESDKRKSLISFKDYQDLFSNYETSTLKQNIKSIEKIYETLIKKKKVALTCFEADKNYCHRYRIVNYMSGFYSNKFEVIHL
jgi:uncharacterized protein (DUF488 family)